MERPLVGIYALAECFVAVIALSITLGVALYDFVQLIVPDWIVPDYKYERHQRTSPSKQFAVGNPMQH